MQVETNHESMTMISHHNSAQRGNQQGVHWPPFRWLQLHIYITPTRLVNDVNFHLEPCHDTHQLKETDIPHPKTIVGGECCPTMVYGHVIAGPTVTTLNTQHGWPLLALAALQLKCKTLGCWWKTSSSIFLGKSLFKAGSVRWQHNNSEFRCKPNPGKWCIINLPQINQNNSLPLAYTTK